MIPKPLCIFNPLFTACHENAFAFLFSRTDALLYFAELLKGKKKEEEPPANGVDCFMTSQRAFVFLMKLMSHIIV